MRTDHLVLHSRGHVALRFDLLSLYSFVLPHRKIVFRAKLLRSAIMARARTTIDDCLALGTTNGVLLLFQFAGLCFVELINNSSYHCSSNESQYAHSSLISLANVKGDSRPTESEDSKHGKDGNHE